jgi:hypothetical protein
MADPEKRKKLRAALEQIVDARVKVALADMKKEPDEKKDEEPDILDDVLGQLLGDE